MDIVAKQYTFPDFLDLLETKITRYYSFVVNVKVKNVKQEKRVIKYWERERVFESLMNVQEMPF